MPTSDPAAGYATFINAFRCKPGDQDEVVRITSTSSTGSPPRRQGFVSASDHRSSDGTRVFNYLQWETPEHLAAMQVSPEFRMLGVQFNGLIEFEPHQCAVAHVAERPERTPGRS